MSARCRRPKCGRLLRTEESIRRGYGPVCWRREHPAEPAVASTVAHPVDPNQIPLPLEVPVDDVNSLISDRLGEFQKLADQTSEAIISGAAEPPAAFAFMLRHFVEATYLAVLAQVKPDLAEATAAWLKDATEAADGTVLEVAYEWRKQIAAGDTPWLPHSILERL